MKATLVKRTFFFMLAMAILLSMAGCGNTEQPTTPTDEQLQGTLATDATGATGATVAPTTPAITEPTDGTLPSDGTEPTVTVPTEDTQPVIAVDPKPTEPKPTEPKPTEPKPTEPKPTEPKPTTPKPTEPKPTEPKPTTPKPTEPAPTEPAPTEAPTEPPTEPKEYIDIDALIEYGHQYGVEKWGFQIDREMGLHGDPVGYFPPAYVKITTMEDGRKNVRGKIDALAERWIANGDELWGYLEDGTEWHARLRIGIEPATDRADYYWIYAYYG